MSRPRRAVVVGASLAGVTAVAALRGRGFEGQVTLVGAERHPAYSRPALSKGVLSGADPVDSVLLPAVGGDVVVRVGVRARSLDLARRRVVLPGGDTLPFDLLVIATGARARRLTADPDEIVLRDLDDALTLRGRLAAARSLLVLGGGFLGLEVASVARHLGLAVTVVDVRPPLVATLGRWPAALLTDAARAAGVRIVVSGDGVRRLGRNAVGLGDGTRLEADLVLTAVGDEPDAGWLAASGVPVCGGVVVDSRGRVADGVAAAGDVAAFSGPDGVPRRMPHWDAAMAQARAAVDGLLLGDAAAAYRPDPYYWTEAFGYAVKIAGPLPVSGPPTVLEGSADGGPALLRWDGGQRPTVVAVNHRLSVGRLRRLAADDFVPTPGGSR